LELFRVIQRGCHEYYIVMGFERFRLFLSLYLLPSMATTERSLNVPRDSLWYSKTWMDRANNDKHSGTSSDSESTSTLVDDIDPGMCFDEYDDIDSLLDLPGIPTPRASDDMHGLYLSPFVDTSTVYGDMPEIPLVQIPWTDHPHGTNNTMAHEQSFWSTLIHPQRRIPVKGEPLIGLAKERSISKSRCAPSLSSSPSTSSTSSSQTKVMPMKSSLSSSSSLKSKDGSSIRRQHPSVKFAATPTVHYDYSYDAEPPAPRNTKVADGAFSKLKRLIGTLRKCQAVPERPSISGPLPMYCASALKDHEPSVRPARSHASLRSTGSASSCSSFRMFWDRLTRPDG